MAISSKWFSVDLFQGDPEAKKKREELVRSSTILDVLTTLIKLEIAELHKAPLADYDSPNWAYKEADRKGQIRALSNLLTLTIRKS